MNSSVTALSEISVMSSSRFEISESSRSNGPLKLLSDSENPVDSSTPTRSATLGDGTTEDQLSGDRAIRLGGGVVGGEDVQRSAGDGGVWELHGAANHAFEHTVAE